MRRLSLTLAAGLALCLPAAASVITEAKGTVVNYNKKAAGTAVFGNSLVLVEDDFPAEIVWSSDNKVYFKNLISTFPNDYYVEGTVSGKTITVAMDQELEYSEAYFESICLGIFKTVPRVENGLEYVDFQYEPDIKSVTFTIGDDESITMQLPGKPFDGETPPEYVLGCYYSEDKSFVGFSDFAQHYTKLDIELVTIPEGADIKQYVYVDAYNYASIVDVAFVGDDLYIRGLSSMLPEGTIRARVSGNKAVVAQDEYLGVYYDQYYIFTKVLYDNPGYDEMDPDSEPFLFAPSDVGFELNIDPVSKTIYADKEGTYLSFHCDADDFLNSLGYFDVFELKYQESFAGTPANPVNLEYHTEWASMQGFNDFFFTLSNFSTSGNLLDVNKLYYKVFVNGEPVVFKEHEMENLIGETVTVYEGVPTDVNLLPYEFNNNDDIFKWSPNAFDIGIYVDDVETIGVQTVYYFEGQFTYSDLVTLEVETGDIIITDGVGAIEADGDDTPAVYYTIDGRRVARPDHGIYIKVQNGRSSKVIL